MNTLKHIHFIAIGGAAMHNLAIALKNNGIVVTGSDDEIYEPSKSYLKEHDLLPETTGWNVANVEGNEHLEIIVGMHTKTDNPELLRAQALGLKIYSYPEYIYEQSKNKQRIVIAGSHGKSTVTSMVMHVLKQTGKEFDYLVGSRIDGFDTMVQLSDAPIIVIEGDEYFASPIQLKPKFSFYQAHILVVTGIAWDHINVYPTVESYQSVFADLIKTLPKAGAFIFDETDTYLSTLKDICPADVQIKPYISHNLQKDNGKVKLQVKDRDSVEIQVFGAHNYKNIQAAKLVCDELNIDSDSFYKAISSFKGAAKRLELLETINNTLNIYRDFAHAPSKVAATVEALKGLDLTRKLLAVYELHTYSSFQEEFLKQYRNTLKEADLAVVFVHENTLKIKNRQMPDFEYIREAFNLQELRIFSDTDLLKNFITEHAKHYSNVLLMSSGNFGNLDLKDLIASIKQEN
jgi:UDP-N-acetylmuramate: L-alanyl-gamma-D-glutamyl-meso-diaminopimelate ligase